MNQEATNQLHAQIDSLRGERDKLQVEVQLLRLSLDGAREELAEAEARTNRIERYGVEWQTQALALRTAAQQGLEALEFSKSFDDCEWETYKKIVASTEAAINALTAALEKKHE